MELEKKPLSFIETGDIILTSGSALLSESIQDIQELKSKAFGIYSHALIARWEGDVLFATEAQKHGICNNNFVERYMNDDYKSIMLLKHEDYIIDNKVKFEQMMMPYIGNTKYDVWSLIAQFVWITSKGKVWIGEKKQKPNDFNCSQWVTYIRNKYFSWQDGRIEFVNDTKIAPVDLAMDERFKKYLLK